MSISVNDAEEMAVLSITAASFTLLICSVAVGFYMRQRRLDRKRDIDASGVVDLLNGIFFLGMLSCFRFIVSGSLKLQGRLEQFCQYDVAYGLFLYIPQVLLEGVFFVFVNVELRGIQMTSRHAMSAIIVAVIISLATVVALYLALALGPGGLHFSHDVAWCFFPGKELDGTTSARLEVMKFFGGYVWYVLTDLSGIICLIVFLLTLRQRLGGIPFAVGVRSIYFLYVIAVTSVFLVSRFDLDPSNDLLLAKLTSFLAPSLAGVNACVFLVTERYWLFGGLCAENGSAGERRRSTDEDATQAGRYPGVVYPQESSANYTELQASANSLASGASSATSFPISPSQWMAQCDPPSRSAIPSDDDIEFERSTSSRRSTPYRTFALAPLMARSEDAALSRGTSSLLFSDRLGGSRTKSQFSTGRTLRRSEDES
jgi:hypothetical protein